MKLRTSAFVFGVAGLLGAGSMAQGAVVGAAVTAGSDNFLSQTISADYTIPGDMFGIRSTLAPGTPGLPFAIQDSSNGTFPTDTQGIIEDPADTAPFFGVVDTINGAETNEGTAEWTFDISSVISDLTLSIDFAAMGDFESSNDTHSFTYSIDAGASTGVFTIAVDEAGSQNYTMASGTAVSLNDPITVNGTALTNAFTTFSESLVGTGSVLTLSYTGGQDGGSEAFAFRNVIVEGVVPEPATAALLGLGGLMLAGRSRRSS